MALLLLIMGLIMFIGLIVVHELGHFIVARRNGVDAEEFGIGFPPTAWRKKIKSKKGDFIFSLNWLPLGGFVKLKGEHDADKAPGTYGAAKLSVKVRIMLAGVAMNLVAALVLMTIVAWVGVPQLPSSAIGKQFSISSDEHIVRDIQNKGEVLVDRVANSSPAEKAGLKHNDQLIEIAGQTIDSHDKLVEVAKQHAGTAVSLVIKRDNSLETKQINLNNVDVAKNSGYLGIQTASGEKGLKTIRYTWSAPVVAAGTTVQFAKLTLQGLGKAFSGLGSLIAGLVTNNHQARQAGQAEATEQVGGPVAIFYVLQEGSKLGLGFILFVISLLSLTLAIMNVLPIPALDGGRLFVTLLFRAFRRRLRKGTEDLIHGTGFALLMVLFILITIVDIHRI